MGYRGNVETRNTRRNQLDASSLRHLQIGAKVSFNSNRSATIYNLTEPFAADSQVYTLCTHA